MTKRLLKDLPFEHLKKDSVVEYVNSGYRVNLGNTYYSTGGSSDGGCFGFDKPTEEILSLVWDNPEWFEEASLNHISFVPSRTSVILEFKPIDIGDAEDLARGIIHILKHLEEGSYVWGKFKNITTKMGRG